MGYKTKIKVTRGIRYREHPTRKNGVKKDRYYFIYHSVHGKQIEEGVGWASEGTTQADAEDILIKLKKAHKTGLGPQTLREQRAQGHTEKLVQKANALTMEGLFKEYEPHSKSSKNEKSFIREEALWRLWIKPIIGTKVMKDLTVVDLDAVKNYMAQSKRSPRTIVYALATIRQMINFAKKIGKFSGDNPVRFVTKPKFDNRRFRFFTPDEAETLLTALEKRSKKVHDIVLLSLYTGMRAGEIFKLTWGDVNMDMGIITIRGTNTKNSRTRIAHITPTIATMFKENPRGKADDLIFPDGNDKTRNEMSQTFDRVVAKLKFNEDVADKLQRVVFHTCRHTFASWLVQKGVDLYVVQQLMGHSSIAMTERYAHLSPKNFNAAVRSIDPMPPNTPQEG